jgi:hypothetical protein
MTAFKHEQDGTTVPSWPYLKAVYKPARHIPVPNVKWKTPDDRHRNCPKHVVDKNKLGKIVAPVDFIKKMFGRV